jgi:hypothetical protein
MMTLFKPQDNDWLLINPELRKMRPGGHTFMEGSAHGISTFFDNTATEIGDWHRGDTIRFFAQGATDQGYFKRKCIVPRGESLTCLIACISLQQGLLDWEFTLLPGSSLKVRYIANSYGRQIHGRIKVRHSRDSTSDVRTACIATGKKSASTVMVEIDMPAGSKRAKSNVKTLNFNNGGRVGSIPIINVSEPDVEAAHGNTVYSVDKESIFMLQLRGIPEDVAKKRIMMGQLLASYESDNIIDDWDEFNECFEKPSWSFAHLSKGPTMEFGKK